MTTTRAHWTAHVLLSLALAGSVLTWRTVPLTRTRTLTHTVTQTVTRTVTTHTPARLILNSLPDTTYGIGLANVNNANGSSTVANENGANPPVQFVWQSSFPASAGIAARNFYTFFDLNENVANVYSQARGTAWFLANHPDWVEYSYHAWNGASSCANYATAVPQATARANFAATAQPGQYVAYIGSGGDATPLDVTNPQVLAYIESTWIKPALDGTLVGNTNGKNLYGQAFSGISFDVINANDTFASAGERCGFYTNGDGRCVAPWTYNAATDFCQQFTALSNDTNYSSADATAVAGYSTYITTTYPGDNASFNFSWNTGATAASQTILNAMQVDLDEAGLTACGGTCGSIPTDATWSTMMTFLSTYLAGNHGWVDLNQETGSNSCGAGWDAGITQAQRQWAIANYLLVKNNHSYIWIGDHQQYGCVFDSTQVPEYAVPIGTWTNSGPCAGTLMCANWNANTGVYGRDFTGGVALVNPSSSSGTVTVTLPGGAGTWTDAYGNTIAGTTTTIGQASGLILLHKTAPTPVPTATNIPTVIGPNPRPFH